YWARIEDIWGYLELDGTFIPLQPDQNLFTDRWSSRKVAFDSYRSYDQGSDEDEGKEKAKEKEDVRPIRGEWYRPWPDRNYFVFVRNSNHQREWARGSDLTRNGYTVGHILERRRFGPYPYL